MTSLLVELEIDGVVVDQVPGSLPSTFTTATLFVGQTGVSGFSYAYYDDIAVWQDGVNLVGNGGFESALAAQGPIPAPIPMSFGNWMAQDPVGSSVAERAALPHTGSFAGQVDILGIFDTAYFWQDINLTPSQAFEVDFWVTRSHGTQLVSLSLDYDRGVAGDASGAATIFLDTGSTHYSAGGPTGGGAELTGGYHHVILRFVLARRPVVGFIGWR